MKLIVVKDYNEMSRAASEIIKDLLISKNDATLGLATGSSPIGIYANLIDYYKKGEISFKNVTTYNLDEYCDLPRSHYESYYSFMYRHLFSNVDINEKNVHLPNASGDLEKACQDYNALLNNATIDLQLLGIGSNGHIGFNEPYTPFDRETWVVELTEQTRLDNKRFFKDLDEVPTHAITMGIKNILGAKGIILVASGKSKANAIKRLMTLEEGIEFPAGALRNHDNVTVIVDEDAASLL